MPDAFVAEPRSAYGSASPEPCYYCGMPAGSIDHVIPQIMLRQLAILADAETTRILRSRFRYETVPACRECNSVLGSLYFDTLAKRRQWVKDRMRVRYRKLLATPEWTDSELGQLSAPMRNYILLKLDEKRVVKRRLAWQEGRAVDTPAEEPTETAPALVRYSHTVSGQLVRRACPRCGGDIWQEKRLNSCIICGGHGPRRRREGESS